MNGEFSWDAFEELPVVGIMRGYSAAETEAIVAACARGALRNLEITMNSAGAAELIRLAREVGGARLNIGAGTVCSLDDLDRAQAAGAEFIITPTVVPDVIRACVARALPVFPGAYSPSEIFQAWQLGAPVVKVFPADQLGPRYIKSLQGPFPQIPLMPVGGVSVQTLGVYKRAGASAFGVGTPLFDRHHVDAGDWEWITRQTHAFAEAYANT